MAGADETLAALGLLLADRVAEAVPSWARAAVARVLEAWVEAGGAVDPAVGDTDSVLARAEESAAITADVVASELRGLAGTDVDAQRVTPLEVVRRAVVPGLTALLVQAGVSPLRRDRFLEQRFPDDLYELAPPSLAAITPELGELGAAWGAAKAAAHRARHGGPVRPG